MGALLDHGVSAGWKGCCRRTGGSQAAGSRTRGSINAARRAAGRCARGSIRRARGRNAQRDAHTGRSTSRWRGTAGD